jgi:hypothetical protein
VRPALSSSELQQTVAIVCRTHEQVSNIVTTDTTRYARRIKQNNWSGNLRLGVAHYCRKKLMHIKNDRMNLRKGGLGKSKISPSMSDYRIEIRATNT